MTSSVSNSELSNNQGSDQLITRDLSKWNPFEDRTPFSQMTEDHIFGAEFDKIRREGSQNSNYFFFNIILRFALVMFMSC